MQKIVIDSDIPFIGGVFEPYFEVLYLKGVDFTNDNIKDASALVVRTRTKCNEELLGGSKVQFVATATIGTDHIDLDYCAKQGVNVASAAGCNARAVAQWVFAALEMLERKSELMTGYRLGIVGVGNVGTEVEAMALERGVEILRCDPPRQQRGDNGFVTLDRLLARCDVVTLHVPLTELTRDMINRDFLSKLGQKTVVMNSSRGEIADEAAILEAISQQKVRYVVDVWRGEPDINLELLQCAEIATPHIAGYSARGKARATTMSVRSVANYFEIKELKEWDCSVGYELERAESFDIKSSDAALRLSPQSFESLRTIRY